VLGVSCDDIRRLALVAMAFSVAGLATTGCSSMGQDVKARLIVPVPSSNEYVVGYDDGSYLPPRSPGFNDLTGS
jgi:hypothetical protein